MKQNDDDAQIVSLFGEILAVEQLSRSKVSKILPKGMELSHFFVLNHLASMSDERSPAQLAKAFHLTRGAMTNTLGKLEWAGYVHVRPDWDDARRKMISLSPAGRRARDQAREAIGNVLAETVGDIDLDKLRTTISVMRNLRNALKD